jgi:MFS transporter, OPA family, sugar phosphate sensor protein UhpC
MVALPGKSDLRSWRVRIFVVSWIAYAALYLCRKNFSVVMPMLDHHGSMGKLNFANIISIYSLMYALGQPVFGALSDRYGPRLIVVTGMILAVASNLAMAVYASSNAIFFLMLVNGIGQAAGWPALVEMMANWFPKERRGIVMSWWTTNYVLGSFLATVFAAYVATAALPFLGAKWQHAFTLPALLLLVVAVVFYTCSRNSPEDVQLATDNVLEQSLIEEEAKQSRADRRAAYLRIMRDPVVMIIACGCLFAKITRYAFLFWLPLYMTEQLRYRPAEAGYSSGMFELAGFFGALIAGYLSDRVFQSRRFPVTACMFWMLAIMCLLQPWMARNGYWMNMLGISLIGIANYGPDTLLQGAASQDAGSGIGTGIVSGFISGVGSIGQLVSPYLVALVTAHDGWDRLFQIFVLIAFVGGCLQAILWKHGKLVTQRGTEALA